MSYLKRQRRARQSAPLRSDQVANSAGGFTWAVDDWTRLRRFLVLGSEGGSYYAGEWELTRENARIVQLCLAEDGARTVAEIVRISVEGRAPKNDPALYALAMAAGSPNEATRKPHSTRCRASRAPARTCSGSRSSSRRSAAGVECCGARSAGGTRRSRWMRSRTRRSSTGSARA